jgi:orotate phosphoribosyltransferase-like protein
MNNIETLIKKATELKSEGLVEGQKIGRAHV